MNAMGWQVGAILFGASALIIAIYIVYERINMAYISIEINL